MTLQLSRAFGVLALSVGFMASTQVGRAQLLPPVPPPNVTWTIRDSVAGCPAGDSLYAVPGLHPSRLRIVVGYNVNVPPESIWVQVDELLGGLKLNDESAKIFADDSVRAGQTRITVPSFSGCGTALFDLYVSGVLEGVVQAKVRTVDTDGDAQRRVTSADAASPCDLNYNGTSGDTSDVRLVNNHIGHWHRNALFGTPVRRTSLLVHSAQGSPFTIGDGGLSWSPHGDSLSYSARVNDGHATCVIYIVPSNPRDGDKPRQFSWPAPDSMDYDPSWSPLGTAIVWDRKDRVIYRKGVFVPGVNSDTSLRAIYGDATTPSTQTAISPDGKTVAMVQQIDHEFHVVTIPIDGGALTQVTSGTGLFDYYPQWSPDGSKLIFERQDFNVNPATQAIYTVAATGPPATPVLLYQVPSGQAPELLMPAFSGDGRIVVAAIQQSPTPHTLDPGLASQVPIRNYAAFTSGATNLLSPRMSPDGTRTSMLTLEPGDVPTDLTPNLWAVRRNMNLPPVISAIGGKSINHQAPYVDFTISQDSTITLTFVRSDPESNPLADKAYFLRPSLGMSFSSSTQTLTWPVGESPVGTYTVGFATSDSSGGTDCALARITVRDITRPARVTSISAQCTPGTENQWDLSWTAVADDSNYSVTGPATSYDIRTYGATITEANWNAATPIGGPTPGTPGGTDTYSVTVSGTTHVAMKVLDEVGNTSLISGQVTLHSIICDGGGMFAGGGGNGAGTSVRRAGGSASLRSESVGFAVADYENSLLNGTVLGSRGHDLLQLPRLGFANGSYSLHIRESAGGSAAVDATKLLLVDHGVGTEAFATNSVVVVGVRSGATHVVTGGGLDVTEQMKVGGGGFDADSGAVLIINTALDSSQAPVVIEAADGGARSKPIVVKCSNGSGGWGAVGAIYPRNQIAAAAIDSVPAGSIRLEFQGYAHLGSVSRLANSASTQQVAWAQLAGAMVGSNDVRSALASADTAAAMLSGADTLSLAYSAEAPADGQVRDVFLSVDATPQRSIGSHLSHLSLLPSIPLQFALHQNQPNPFHSGTAIRFDLPTGQVVRLNVYDAQGRRVRALANHFIPAGYQSVLWDQKDDGGAIVHPGVYFYALQTQVYQARRKMILLP